VSMLQPTSSLKTLVQLENMQRIDSIESRSTKSIATHFKMGMEHEKRVKSPAQHAQPGPATFKVSLLSWHTARAPRAPGRCFQEQHVESS
jgi:hypothetical protein